MPAPLFPHHVLRTLDWTDEGAVGKEHQKTGLQRGRGGRAFWFCALDLDTPVRQTNKSWILPGALKRCVNGLERSFF